MSVPDVIYALSVLRKKYLPQYMDLPVPLREAEIFARLLREVPIGLPEHAAFAGDIGWEWASQNERAAIDADIALLKCEATLQEPVSDDERIAHVLGQDFHIRAGYTKAHFCVNYARLLHGGLASVRDEIAYALTLADDQQRSYLQAMDCSILAVVAFARRFSTLAAERLAAEGQTLSHHDALQLDAISRSCLRVPENPPQTFAEALQFLWIMSIALAVSEYSSASLSFGTLDQFLLPLYMQDLQRGISSQTLEAELESFIRKINTFGDAAKAINLGPLAGDAEHNRYNALSRLILKCVKQVRQPAPILAVRMYDNAPLAEISEFICPELFSIGQPTFYGEQGCRNTLRKRGVAESELSSWAVSTCMALTIPESDINDSWGSIMNMLVPLEMTVHRGTPFEHAMPLKLRTVCPAKFSSFADFYRVYLSYVGEFVAWCVARHEQSRRTIAREAPNPFFSALVADCIRRGQDRADGGVKSHVVVMEAFGLVNAADALLAIEQLIFKEQKYTLEDLSTAAAGNFAQHESLRTELLTIQKFGNGSNEEMVKRLATDYAELIRSYDHDNLIYAPSFHTLDVHVAAGGATSASLDGRRKGEPLAKNMGASAGRSINGHTALILSAAQVPQDLFCGGQALDLSLPLGFLNTPEEKEKFAALLLTYFKLGGLQVQVNSVSPELLLQARKEPLSHEDLLVRIGGYTRPFVSLAPMVQDEMIVRFSRGQ